jgi:hypothetical protein
VNSHEDGAAPVERRLDDAFRAPEFDDARAERILTAARTVEVAARRVRGRSGGVRLAVALAACAAVLVGVVAWPSVRGEHAPAGSTTARDESFRGTAARLSATDEGAPSAARERHRHPYGRLFLEPSWGAAYSAPTYRKADAGDAVVMSLDHGLRLSAERVSAPVASGELLVVRLTLTNVSSETVRWNAFRFWLSTTTTFQPVPTIPGGIYFGSSGLTRALRSGPPLALRSGESTTAVLPTAVPAGTWRVVGWYEGDPGELSGHTPTMTVLVHPRR